jgi:hypothetical protein
MKNQAKLSLQNIFKEVVGCSNIIFVLLNAYKFLRAHESWAMIEKIQLQTGEAKNLDG